MWHFRPLLTAQVGSLGLSEHLGRQFEVKVLMASRIMSFGYSSFKLKIRRYGERCYYLIILLEKIGWEGGVLVANLVRRV